MNFTLAEIKDALDRESIGKSNARYVIENLTSEKLASQLKGLFSDPRTNLYEVARGVLYGYLDTEYVVRLAHGENMNKVHTIISDFKLELQMENKK
jgi:hypothetical protein